MRGDGKASLLNASNFTGSLGRPWLTNSILIAIGGGLFYFSHRFVSENDTFTRLGITGIAIWSVALFLAAVSVVLTQPSNHWTLRIILLLALAFRIAPLLADPFLSSDIYRYVWDGIVQHAHINPYRYVPADAALSFLREPHQEIYDNINRRDYARTIYPPVAQMIFFLSAWQSSTVLMMKIVMLAFEALSVVALTQLLHLLGRPREHVLLYAWCPLLVWEIGDAGHVDAVVIAFVSMALLFRARGNNLITGLFLGLAVMTKFYPLVLFPALYRRGDWKMPAALAGVCVVGYTIYSSVGMGVFGFLGGYTEEEGITSGTRYFLLQWIQTMPGLHSVPANAYLAACALVFLALTLWAWRTACVEAAITPGQFGAADGAPHFLRAAAVFGFALMLLFSPHYPWYLAWLVLFLPVAFSLPMLAYVMLLFYLFTTPLGIPGPGLFLGDKIVYITVACAAVLHLLLRALKRRQTSRI